MEFRYVVIFKIYLKPSVFTLHRDACSKICKTLAVVRFMEHHSVELNRYIIHWKKTRNFIQIYHVWKGYLRKIPVERRKISRAEWRGKFSLKTGIFRKYETLVTKFVKRYQLCVYVTIVFVVFTLHRDACHKIC
jgi:hypothetical protein